MYLIRHSKSKRSTNREFIVSRFLPTRASKVLFLYLVYVRPFADLLCREQAGSLSSTRPANPLLFQSLILGRPWPTARFGKLFVAATQQVWLRPVPPRWYRQLSIGISEKHVQAARISWNRYDDHSDQADPDVAFAWQSGHRPLQRSMTYGLDGAFPTKLQPALLQAYERASREWHRFLHLEDPSSATVPTATRALVPTSPNITRRPPLSPTVAKRPAAPPVDAFNQKWRTCDTLHPHRPTKP
jgi:hypothetical protein